MGSERRELHRVSAGESSASTATDANTSFASSTSPITERRIAEIWGLKSCRYSH